MIDNEKIVFALKLIKEACENQSRCEFCLLKSVPNSICTECYTPKEWRIELDKRL